MFVRLDNDPNPVAYGFLADEDEPTGTQHHRFIQLFYSAADARNAMACATPDIQVLICDAETPVTQGISPLNLAAALHKDNPLRDIYIEKDQPNKLYISRAEAAGARGVVTRNEAERIVCLPSGSTEKRTEEEMPIRAATPKSKEEIEVRAEAKAEAKVPVVMPENCDFAAIPAKDTGEDLAWLEEVLELDELDEIAQTAGLALAEKPKVLTGIADARITNPKQLSIVDPTLEGLGIAAAFVSGRGGVGKSSLTVLTALELWLSGSRVVMVDMDLQFGDLGVLSGNEPESNFQRIGIEQLLNGRARIPQLEGSLLIVEAPLNLELAEELVHQIPELLHALKGIADIVLINTSCLWNEVAAVLATSVDKIVVCMDQRATSVSAARQVVELCVRLQIPSTHLHYLLNRSARNSPITDIDASLAMGGVKVVTIAEGGADVDELLSLGCPLEVLSAQSALRHSIHDLGLFLLAQPGREAGHGGGVR